MEGTQSDYFGSYFPYLFDAQERYRYVIHYDPMAFLKSKGAILTPEEEETAEWFASNLGKTLYLTSKETDDYNNRYYLAYQLAKRSGLEQEYLDFCTDERRKMKEQGIDDVNIDTPYNVSLQADAIKQFTGRDDVPFLWQAIQTYLLTEGNGLNIEDYSKDQMNDIIDRIKDTNVITHPVLTEAFTKFFDKAYSKTNYELPDDERGRIIKEIIEPYKGKVILLDFWGTSCGLCRNHIEESAEERKRNLDNPDYKRIFISSPVDSWKPDYDKYVEENLADETNVWLSELAYRKVQDLFSFSGLPRYVLIDRDGKVLNDDLDFAYRHMYLYDLGITL
ncbi:MAG: thioredoxin family protein [Muribaculaceae bacterium]|nr:thioredoxin family protein [Muribaculaceae bacterium]